MQSPLSDTDEHEAIEDLPPEKLRELANSPASELFVLQQCMKCWVKRWVRRVRLKWAFIFGVLVVIQAGGWYVGSLVIEDAVDKVMKRTAPVYIEPVVRETVLKVLKEHHLILGALRAPADSVASLVPGGTQ
jgi:hypothetical protein